MLPTAMCLSLENFYIRCMCFVSSMCMPSQKGSAMNEFKFFDHCTCENRAPRRQQQHQEAMSESPISTPQQYAITVVVAGAVTEAFQRSSGQSGQEASVTASLNEGSQTPLSSSATSTNLSTPSTR